MCCVPVTTHAGVPRTTAVPGLRPMSAFIVPPVTQVMVEPARIPKPLVVPGGTIGGGGDVTIAVAVPKIVPLVALTVLVNVPTAPPAVKGAVSPVVPAGMVPPPAVTDQVGADGEMT